MRVNETMPRLQMVAGKERMRQQENIGVDRICWVHPTALSSLHKNILRALRGFESRSEPSGQ